MVDAIICMSMQAIAGGVANQMHGEVRRDDLREIDRANGRKVSGSASNLFSENAMTIAVD